MSACKILISPFFDNSAFHQDLLIKKGLEPASIQISEFAPNLLPTSLEWYPLILFSHPNIFEPPFFLAEKLSYQGQNWYVLDPVMTFQNRVFVEPLTLNKGLHIFTQSNCYPCHTLMRKLDQMDISYTRLNQRSELWYRLKITKTPAMIWNQTYFFDSPRGFLLTPYASISPSGNF